ncbi:MAG TPA: hypothetical protein VJ733_09995 [Candidatus Binatia bacterium]|nr:hypothetical protein [Candidatus Binatia bacterium]
MAEQVLDIAIRVVKQGDGDEAVAAGLEELKTATGETTPALEKLEAASETADEKMGQLGDEGRQLAASMEGVTEKADAAAASVQKLEETTQHLGTSAGAAVPEMEATTRAAEGSSAGFNRLNDAGTTASAAADVLTLSTNRQALSALRMIGVNQGLITSLKGVGLANKLSAGSSLLSLGAFTAVAAGVGVILYASKKFEGALKLEKESSEAANTVEEKRAKMLEGVGLAARSTTKDILEFVAGQNQAIESFERFSAAGEKEQKFFEQEVKLRDAERGGRSQIAALEFERGGIGLEGPSKAAFELSSKKAALARDEEARQEKLSDLAEKKASLEENLGKLEELHSNRNAASSPKTHEAEAKIIAQKQEQLDALSKQIQIEGTQLLQLQKVNAEKRKNIDLTAESEKQKAAEAEQQAILGLEFAAAEKAKREEKEANRENADAALKEAAAAQKAKIDAMTFGAAGAAPSSFIGIRGPEAGRAGFRMLGGDQPRGAGFVGIGGAPAGLQQIGVKKEDVAGAAKQTGKSVGDELKAALAGFPDDVVSGLAPEIEKLTQQLSSEMSKKFAEWVKTGRN